MAAAGEIDLKIDGSASPASGLKKSRTSTRKQVERKITKHTDNSWFSVIHLWINTALTQKWMDVAAEHTQSDVKLSLYDENVQLALVSSLVLTMVFPLMYEFNADWIETAQTGFIARQTEHFLGINIFGEDYFGIWHDMSMAGYNWGVACMITTVVLCLINLIAINEIQEEQAITFLKAMGPLPKKYAFRMLVLGLVLPLAGPMMLRIYATLQTFGGFFHFIISGIIVVYCLFSVYRVVKALYVCIDESEGYDNITLTEEECESICKVYFERFPNTYTLEGYANCLTYVTPMKYKVPLTYCTKVRMLKCFYKNMCAAEGLNLSDDSLARFCIEGAKTFRLDHRGQELELGDEPEQILEFLKRSTAGDADTNKTNL
jgi:hypothetical protein